MSWESTELYYRLINEGVKRALGGLHSARIALVSVDFEEVETLQHRGDWDGAGALLAKEAQRVESAGADLLLICTNTMHRVAPQVEAAIGIPLLHIADATADRILESGKSKVGLLGTRFTMEQEFYRGRMEERGVGILVPAEDDRAVVHRVIYEELCLGEVRDDSRAEFVRIVESLRDRGAEGVIEGCTEVGMLVKPEHTDVALFDTTAIHAEAAVSAALSET